MMRIILATCCVAMATFGVAHADFMGLVTHVSDGDTIKVRDRCSNIRTVRMLGIDAPEKKQEFGLASRANLTKMVSNKRVYVRTSSKDQYGRDVGKVILAGKDVNLAQIQDGFAWHYKAYEQSQSVKDRLIYHDAESAARAKPIGLWSGAAIAPWEFRRWNR